MIKIYVDLSKATQAEIDAIRPSTIEAGIKAAIVDKFVPIDYSITFTNEQVIETGRILTSTIGIGVKHA